MWTYNELYHHGILGQKWGVRRFQNADGSLTSAGRERYLPDHNFKSAAAEYKLNMAYANYKRKSIGRFKIKSVSSVIRKNLFYKRAKNRFEKALDEIGENYILNYDENSGRYLVRPLE